MGLDSDSLRGGRYGDRIPVGGGVCDIFRTRPDRLWGTTPSYTMGTGSFPGVKRPRRGVEHQPPSSAEVKERVDRLYSVLAFMACSKVNFISFLPFLTQALD